MSRLYSHQCEYRKIFLGNYLCIGFVPGGISPPVSRTVSNSTINGRNRAIVIAESLVRVIAAIRITSVRWRSYLPLKPPNLVLVDLAFVALLFESRDWRLLV